MEKVIKNKRDLELVTIAPQVTKQVQKPLLVMDYMTKFDDVI